MGYTICYYEAASVYEACIDQVFTTTWAGIMVVVRAETVFVFRLSKVISMINVSDKKNWGKVWFLFFYDSFQPVEETDTVADSSGVVAIFEIKLKWNFSFLIEACALFLLQQRLKKKQIIFLCVFLRAVGYDRF